MKTPRLALLWLAALTLAGTAIAAPIHQARRPRPLRVTVVDNSQRIDINQVSMVVTNTGSFALDKSTGGAGLEFPINTGKTAVFAAGLWLGAQVNGKVRIAISEYSDEYQPGSVIAGVPDDPTLAIYKTYKLNRIYADPVERDDALADYNSGAVPHGAPIVTVQPDGSLDVPGDQMLWAVYNDLNPAKHNNDAGKTLPMGVEIQQTTFAYSRQGALGNTVFMRYKITNAGPDTLKNMFVSQWSDPDLGGFTDDLVGCDTVLSLGYVYNANNNDEQYGGQPPSVGYDFLQGPKVGGVPLGLSSFNKYINGTDPDDSLKTYNFMQGLNANGTAIINPTNGLPTRYQVSGDPVTGAGWLDTAPADRRLQLSSGPFTMAPGDTQIVVAGIVVGQSSNRLASISLMKFYDSSVQAAYDANFDLPSPPKDPIVTASPRSGEVFLSWDITSEDYNEPGYAFQGYVVYQGASTAGPWTRVVTYDLVDGITTVLDDDFDEEQGLILPTGKAFGQDVGLKHFILIDEDKVRGGPLNNGTQYYYAVTGYAVGIGQVPQVLESAILSIPVVPQSTTAGVDPSSALATDPEAGQLVPAPGGTTDQVTVTVVDPAQVVTADYRIFFTPSGPGTVWSMSRTMGGVTDTVITDWPNYSGDNNYQVIDGLQVKIVSKPPGTLGRVSFTDTTGADPGTLEGVDRGVEFFGGGGGYAAADVGSAFPDQGLGPNIVIRFTGGTDASMAYRYLREPVPPDDAIVYDVKGYVPVPFRVYNLDTGTQLAAAFLESIDTPTDDGIWNPGVGGNGGREGIFVWNLPYGGDLPDPEYFNTVTGTADNPDFVDMLTGELPIFYEFFSARTSAGATVNEGDRVNFVTSIPATPNDFFTFSSTAENPFNPALATDQLSQIRAVPNPYFAHSVYELNQFDRQLKFTHLPANCTIRIFNLAGDLVRTLNKNDNTSLLTWDLNTKNGLPVGSGIYIYHVDAPGAGSTSGKVVVFMEKERLNNF